MSGKRGIIGACRARPAGDRRHLPCHVRQRRLLQGEESMKTVVIDSGKLIYDPTTDVMYFGLGQSRFTDEEEVAPGIHVLYAYDGKRLDDVVAVEIEYFNERFGNAKRIEIPGSTPFELELPLTLA